MPVVAVVNQKGGVGKTTVALGLAEAAATRGQRVLVVDLDPQGNASTGLGVLDLTGTVDKAIESDQPGSIAEVLTVSAWDVAVPPDVAASTPALAAREAQLATDPIGAQDRLRVALQGVSHDLVIIDCPPSLGLLTVNGLFAADRALVVTAPNAWATDGVEQVRRTIDRVSARRSGELQLAGIVVNNVGRTRDARYWFDELVRRFGGEVFPPVHQRAAIAEAGAQSLPLRALGTRAGATEAIEELDAVCDRLLGGEASWATTRSAAGPVPA
ncbi:MAG: ParA family protein [Acidimicrobiia bacterium]